MEKEINIAGASPNILDTTDKSILEKDERLLEKLLLAGKRIGISISDSPDLLKLGYSFMHLQDAAIEFARYLLVHGATLVYGGDLRKDGFTNLFSDLPKIYTRKESYNEYHFKNYFAWPIYLKLTKSNELDFKQKKAEIIKVPPPKSVKIDETIGIAPDTNENKSILAKSISYMRETMNDNCDARIFLGGQVQNFRGKYPGIFEEAYLALSKNIPVYFVGTYGGATKEIINLITDQPANFVSEEYQISDKNYEEFYKYWNGQEQDKIDYTELSKFFIDYGLMKVAGNNGVDVEENKRLFETNSLPEMIYYVLKGLTAIQN
jgi:hypothetical protein